jgi:hypothetical protein
VGKLSEFPVSLILANFIPSGTCSYNNAGKCCVGRKREERQEGRIGTAEKQKFSQLSVFRELRNLKMHYVQAFIINYLIDEGT